MTTSDAEQRLAELGLYLDEHDLERDDEPDIDGFALVEPLPDGSVRIVLCVRPGAPQFARDGVAEWALTRIPRFLSEGPEPDGWQRRKVDGAWQLWLRRVQLPSLDDDGSM